MATVLLTVAVAGGLGGSHAHAADTFTPKALDYLHACQHSDGGFGEKGSASSDALTAWAMVAIAAAGEDCTAWKVGPASPVTFLSGKSATWKTTLDYARTTLAVAAAGKNPRSFAGTDLVARLTSDMRDHGKDGDQLGPYVNSHAWAMIALKAAGQTPTQREVTWLIGQQNADGGWGWAPGLASDTNDTAAAMEALAAAGESGSSSAMSKAVAYLRARQLSDGGFAYSPGAKSDANSTAWVVQGLIAAGQSPSGWRKSGGDPVSWLRKQQAADGSERYSASAANNPLLVTVQAIPAVCGRRFPVSAPKSAKPVTSWRPTIAAVWPTSGASVGWAAGSTLRFNVADGTGVGVSSGGVSVWVDGAARKVTLSGGTATVQLTTPETGSHTVKTTVIDRAGNSSSSQWGFTVTSASTAASSAGTTASPATASAAGTASVGGAATPFVAAEVDGASEDTSSTPPLERVMHGLTTGGLSDPALARMIGVIVAVIGSLAAVGVLVAIGIVTYRRKRP